jgi:hypothetical protein
MINENVISIDEVNKLRFTGSYKPEVGDYLTVNGIVYKIISKPPKKINIHLKDIPKGIPAQNYLNLKRSKY